MISPRMKILILFGTLAPTEMVKYEYTSKWLLSYPKTEIVVEECRRYVRMLCECDTMRMTKWAVRYSPHGPAKCYDESQFLVKGWEGRNECGEEMEKECLGGRRAGGEEKDGTSSTVRFVISAAIVLGCALLVTFTCLFAWYKSGQLQDEEYLERKRVLLEKHEAKRSH